MNSNSIILVADDDKEIVEAISIYLTREGLSVIKAYDGVQAMEALETQKVDLVLLDIMMPRMDGMKAMLKIRETCNVPIIFISAKSEDTDKILGLNLGADDYITKPFNPLELIARVKSGLRRYTNFGSAPENVKSNTLKSGDLVIDDDEKTVYADGQEVRLTPIEYKILHFLMLSPGRVYSIDQIYEGVWNEPNIGGENTVAVHIRRIREKIEINPKEPKYLKVVWGVGYKIEKH